MEIIKDFNNKLLKRKELLVGMKVDKTPSMIEAQDAISAGQKAEKELVVVKSIRSGFGTRNFEVEAFVYDSVEQKAKTESKPKVKKAPGAA
jgi:ribosomal protein S24E